MFNLNHYFFGILAGACSVVGFIPYLRAIFKKETRPSGPSWWTWWLLTTIATASAWYAGTSLQVLLLPLWLCFSQLLVAILSVKMGDNNWDFLNKICVVTALLGALLWFFTGEPLIALGLSITADFFASIPNFRHIFVSPGFENRLGWTLGWFSALFEIFAVKAWSLAEAGWAVYFLLSMTVTLLLIWRPALKS